MSPTPSHPPSTRAKNLATAVQPQPPGGAAAARRQRELEARANRIARAHARDVSAYLKLRKLGLSRAAAASEVGRGMSTMDKWLVRYQAGGVDALRPKLSFPIGRPMLPGLESFNMAVIAGLQKLSVELGSTTKAARAYRKDRFCPTALSRYIRLRGRLPQRLRALVGFRRRPVTLRSAGSFTLVEELRRSLERAA